MKSQEDKLYCYGCGKLSKGKRSKQTIIENFKEYDYYNHLPKKYYICRNCQYIILKIMDKAKTNEWNEKMKEFWAKKIQPSYKEKQTLFDEILLLKERIRCLEVNERLRDEW